MFMVGRLGVLWLLGVPERHLVQWQLRRAAEIERSGAHIQLLSPRIPGAEPVSGREPQVRQKARRVIISALFPCSCLLTGMTHEC